MVWGGGGGGGVYGTGKQVFEALLLWHISKLLHPVFTPKTVMLHPASIMAGHGMWRVMAWYLAA